MGMNKLPLAKRTAVIRALVEGNSIRSTERITDVSRPTILKLLADIGVACAAFHNATVRNLRTSRIQCDEVWSFIGAKQKNVTEEQRAQGWGDCWTWTALDADTKLIVSWQIGGRDQFSAWWFMRDLTSRLISRVQLTTDGFFAYPPAVRQAFEGEVDYAQLVKMYGATPERTVRYSPSTMIGIKKEVITGTPDEKYISTSFVERSNLSMRMSMRRFTRLTNGFSKKAENHAHAIALYFVHYNFCRVHGTLKITPAMAAGVADHVWSLEEVITLLDTSSAQAA